MGLGAFGGGATGFGAGAGADENWLGNWSKQTNTENMSHQMGEKGTLKAYKISKLWHQNVARLRL